MRLVIGTAAVVGLTALGFWYACKWALRDKLFDDDPSRVSRTIDYHNSRIFELLKLFVSTTLAEAAGIGLLVSSVDARSVLRAVTGFESYAQAIVTVTGLFLVVMAMFHKYAKARYTRGTTHHSLVRTFWAAELIMCCGMSAVTIILAFGLLPALTSAARSVK